MGGARSSKIHRFNGEVVVPGDKSISHRSLILGALAQGVTRISHLLESDDVMATLKALRQLGVVISKETDQWLVYGSGLDGLSEPKALIDMENTGTGVRLLMGVVSHCDFETNFTGDASLCKRPMGRVIDPLTKMGVTLVSAQDNLQLPMTLRGSGELRALDYTLPVASAQVKSAILLAGLGCEGVTIVREPKPTRDHTELMLQGFGAEVSIELESDGSRVITLIGRPKLKAIDIEVPSDPSSAAFVVVAALITPDARVVVRNVCLNPLRSGLYQTLLEMGANIIFENERVVAGERVADIVAESSHLVGVDVPADRAPSMIDEYPILSVAASVAKGKTTMNGLAELRVKESDRLAAISDALHACGVKHDVKKDALIVDGAAGNVLGGGLVHTHMDHRIAMSYLVMGLASDHSIDVDDTRMIETSFPDFIVMMNQLGANITND